MTRSIAGVLLLLVTLQTFGPRTAAAAPRPRLLTTRTLASTSLAAEVTLVDTGVASQGFTGVAYHEPSRGLLFSANAPAGLPNNLVRLAEDGTTSGFSSVTGLTGELPVAAARGGADGTSLGGFPAGEVFVGSDAPGTILRIAGDGTTVPIPLANEPGRVTALTVDTTGRFDGDLLVATGFGNVWRVDAANTARLIVSLGTPVSSLTVVSTADARYGPW